MEDLDEIVHEFLVESHENLDQLDSDLVALEAAPGSKELLGSVFRTIHTIKGTSGFLAFTALERVTHAGENLLVELRDGRRSMDLPTTDVLLEMVDTVREILRRIEADGSEGDIDVDPVVARVTAVLENRVVAAAEPAPVAECHERGVGGGGAAVASGDRVPVQKSRPRGRRSAAGISIDTRADTAKGASQVCTSARRLPRATAEDPCEAVSRDRRSLTAVASACSTVATSAGVRAAGTSSSTVRRSPGSI